jgi:hypothetical protein
MILSMSFVLDLIMEAWEATATHPLHIPPPPANTTTPQPPHQTPPIPATTTAPPRHKAIVSLPYHRGTLEIISRAFCKADVGIISSNKNSLCTQLVHLKDPIPHTHKSTVVYHVPCAGNINDPCSATYIGETERSTDIRLKKHHNKAKLPLSDKYASAIGQHARTTDHHFRPEDIRYLAKESDKMARGIKEAIYAHALDPPLNRGGGLQHFLPPPHMTTSSRPPYIRRNPPRPVLQAPRHPPSTSTAPNPRADSWVPATASYASHSSTPPSPKPRPHRPPYNPLFHSQPPCAAPAAPARTLPP